MTECVSGAPEQDADDTWAPAAAPDSDPDDPRSQTYLVRIPADSLENLHGVAEQLGESPAHVLRRWALERLDSDSTWRSPAERPEPAGANPANPAGRTTPAAGERDGACRRGEDRRAGALRLGSTRRLIPNRHVPEQVGPEPALRRSLIHTHNRDDTCQTRYATSPC
jgi:hypothetical protein